MQMKKNGKRILALCLGAALMLCTLTACGEEEKTLPKEDVVSENEITEEKVPETEEEPEKQPSEGKIDSVKPEKEPEGTEGDEQLAFFRKSMENYNKTGAIMYLGWYEGELGSEAFYKAFSDEFASVFLMYDIPKERMIDADGYEVYCLIPAAPDTCVEVNEWIIDESNDYMGEPGEVLYRSETGEPVIIRGGGEYMPSFAINMAEADGSVLSDYTPTLSGEDGSVILPYDSQSEEPMLFDYTLYEEDFPAGGKEQGYGSDAYFFPGEWYAYEVFADDQSIWSIDLSISKYGDVVYSYQQLDGDIEGTMYGMWFGETVAEDSCEIGFSIEGEDDYYYALAEVKYYNEGIPYLVFSDLSGNLPGISQMGCESVMLDIAD